MEKEKIETLRKEEIVGQGGNNLTCFFRFHVEIQIYSKFIFEYNERTRSQPNKSMIIKNLTLFFILCPIFLFAQDPKQKENLQQLIDTEKAFAQASINKGTKPAFLDFLSKESIVFDKSMPVNGLEYWQKNDFKGIITWQPIVAEIAGSSDLGYTVGNYQFHKNKAEEKPSMFGSFVTLWKKQSNNSWKVAVDMGVSHDEVIANGTNIKENYSMFKPYEFKNQMVLAERMVFMNDHFYWKNAKKSLNPFEPHLAQNVRIYRKNLKPIIGKENAKIFLKKTYDKNLVYTGLKAISSNAGDLVCVYGVISGAGKSGTYLRIYKQEAKDAWKIVVEMVDL